MMMKSFISRNGHPSILFLVIGILIAVCCIETTNAELKQVNVIFRHGDRTPDNNGHEMYPNDPYLDYDFYPMGLGQLTNSGKMREFKLGEVLRKRYDNYLGKVFTPKSVSAVSSNYDRTKMSLQLVLAALFPPAPIQQFNSTLNWQPVPAHYILRPYDNIFLADECPLFVAEYNRVLNSVEGLKKIGMFDSLSKQLSIWTGKNMSKPLDWFYLYHTLMAESSLGLPLPDWAHPIFPHGKLWDATVFAYESANSNTLLRRLNAGPYLRHVREKMVALRNGTLEDPRKMYLFSGHETNIAAMLFALNLYHRHVPEYSSSVILELHELHDTYYVKILYYLGIPATVTELRMPGCDILCPLDKFLELTADVTPSDDEIICDKSITQDYANYKMPLVEQSLDYNLIRTAKSMKK